MNDLLIKGTGGLTPPSVTGSKPDASAQSVQKSFGAVLKDTITDINKLQSNADDAISKVQVDNTGSIHEAMIALEKANLSFRAMMQVRNKIVDAYQEVMRMSV